MSAALDRLRRLHPRTAPGGVLREVVECLIARERAAEAHPAEQPEESAVPPLAEDEAAPEAPASAELIDELAGQARADHKALLDHLEAWANERGLGSAVFDRVFTAASMAYGRPGRPAPASAEDGEGLRYRLVYEETWDQGRWGVLKSVPGQGRRLIAQVTATDHYAGRTDAQRIVDALNRRPAPPAAPAPDGGEEEGGSDVA
jgi:hypothetical protein